MEQEGSTLAHASCDGDDRLIHADEPLAGLQRRCGGEIPGVIAIPELLDLVRKARRYRFRMGRAIHAIDGSEAITAWIEVLPRVAAEGEAQDGGCDIRVRNWQSAPAPVEDSARLEQRRHETNRFLAELSVQLDAGQRLLAVTAHGNQLDAVAAAMKAGIGRLWTDFLTPEDMAHEQPLHWRLLDGAKIRLPGSARTWRAMLIPQLQPGFDPAGFELLLVSEQPPSDEPAKPAPVPRQAARSMIGQNLVPVLHRPISRIIANAETIRTRLAGPLPDDYADYAKEISSAGQHLLDLLKDLADLEVVESEDFATAPDRIDLAEVCRQAAGILGVRAREAGVVIDAPQSGESLPAIAEFRRVLQILLNLVGNAINYAPDGSHVWLRLEDRGAAARVIVADAGPGLSEADQARIFEKFERLGRSGDGGSGLGLFISRRLARAMGGDLTVESAPGQGARFYVDLPADPDA